MSRLVLAVDESGQPELMLAGEDGHSRAVLCLEQDRAVLQLRNADGSTRRIAP